MPHLTRDDRIRVLTLHEAGFTKAKICEQLGFTRAQVVYTINQGLLSPRKRDGRPKKLTTQEVDAIIAYIRTNAETRQKSWRQIALHFADLRVNERTIQRACEIRGYKRHVVRHTPPLSDK